MAKHQPSSSAEVLDYVTGSYGYMFRGDGDNATVLYYTSKTGPKGSKEMPLKQWLSLGGPKPGEDHFEPYSKRYNDLMAFKARLMKG